MENSTLIILGIVIVVLFIFRSSIKRNNPKSPEQKAWEEREGKRELIRGKRKIRIASNGVRNWSDEEDLQLVLKVESYRMGKLFEMAAKTPNNSLDIGYGQRIEPMTREHGLKSGENAEKIRFQIMEEYGIDIETMEDTPDEYLNQTNYYNQQLKEANEKQK